MTNKSVTTNPQLPEDMQDCTIRFIKCDVGHGRLTATNWTDNGCPQCRIDKLLRANEGLAAIAEVALSQWSRI